MPQWKGRVNQMKFSAELKMNLRHSVLMQSLSGNLT